MKVFFILGFLLVHDWYPDVCCGGLDCRAVPCDSITEDKTGYFYDGIYFKTAQPSPDGKCHACITVNGVNRWGTCLFIQVVT